jgi:hypothetical protein
MRPFRSDPMGSGARIRNRLLFRAIAGALALAFALRALIPVGYMPDFATLSKGSFEVVICSAAGHGGVAILDLAGRPAPHKHGGKVDHVCAFSGMAAVAFPVVQSSPVVIGRTFLIQARQFADSLVPPARAGPPLGSRGPPAII